MSEPFLGNPIPFHVAHPKIKTIKIFVKHKGELSSPTQENEIWGEHSSSRIISCPNPECKNGGFDLRNTIDDVERRKLKTHETNLYCEGYEKVPKGKIPGESCFNSVHLVIEATHADEEIA